MQRTFEHMLICLPRSIPLPPMTEYLVSHSLPYYHYSTLQSLSEGSVLFLLREVDLLQAHGIENGGTVFIGGIIGWLS